jgi:hypothetical protein
VQRLLALASIVSLVLFATGRPSHAAAGSQYTQLILHVNATTTIDLSLVTDTAGGGCTLVNSGSNWAAMDLGKASRSAATTCASFGSGNTYTLSTSLAFLATCSGTCTNWNLTAELAAAPANDTTWRLGTTNLSTTSTSIGTNLSYAAADVEAFRLSVKTNGAGAAPTGALQQVITFTATANGVAGVTATATLNAESINEPGISIFFVQDASGVAMTGGAFDAAIDLGTVSAYSSLPPGVTRPSVTATNYTVQTLFDVNVGNDGVTSSNYTMQSSLAAAAPTGFTYYVNGVALTTSPQTVTSTGAYDSNVPYTLGILISSSAPGSGGPTVGSQLSDTLDFTATPN